jgi:hypothetical protein
MGLSVYAGADPGGGGGRKVQQIFEIDRENV